MHELSLAQGIVEIVDDQAARDGFRVVRRIRLVLGALSHVDPDALAFGFEVAARGTRAEGAALDVDRPPGRGFCTDCGREVEVPAHGAPCPLCGEYRWIVVGGNEMKVVELEVE